jgi:hypothetical protein
LVEIGHGEVRVATTEPGTSLAYRDGNFLEVIVAFERKIGGDKVCKGGGEEGIFIVIESRNVEK